MKVVLLAFQEATGHTMGFSGVSAIQDITGVQQKILMHQAWFTSEVYGVLSNTVTLIF